MLPRLLLQRGKRGLTALVTIEILDRDARTSEPPAEGPPIPYRALFALGAAAFGSSASLRMCDPLLAKIGVEFSITVGAAAAIVTGFAIAYGLFQLVTGPLGDRFGKVRLIAAGAIASGAFTLVSALATSLDQLAFLRVAAGLAGAAIIPNCLAFIGDTITLEKRQAVLARFMLAMNMGVVCGQAIGGVVADIAGWRGVFVLVGTVLLAAGGALLAERRVNPVLAGGGTANPRGLLGSFLEIWGLRRKPLARLVLATVFLEAMFFFGPFTFVGAHLREVHHLDYAVIGAIVALSSIGAAVYAVIAPKLINRFGETRLITASAVIFALGLGLIGLGPPVMAIALAIVLMGFGFVMIHNSLQTNATQMNPEGRGAGVAAFAFCFFMGQMAGVTVFGFAYDRFGAPPLFVVAALVMPIVALGFRVGLARLKPA